MTTNLHDKMLAAIDAYFSASDGDERDQAEEQLLDVRDEIRKQPAQQCVCGEPETSGTHRTAGPCYAEQPAQQEPVAWMYEGDAEFDGNDWRYPTRVTTSKQVAEFHGGDVRPLYTTPQAQPAREWVGLTFGEICECESEYANVFARNIEAKLKEKNT